MKKQLIKFFKGFKYAFNGIAATVKSERNFRFHMVTAIYVYALTAFYEFTATEYALITICVFSTLAAEIMNSAIERCAAKPDTEHDAFAGMAKDMAAGSVLVTAIGSAVCGVLLFWDVGVFKKIFAFFTSGFLPPILLAITLVAAFLFVFKSEEKKK